MQNLIIFLVSFTCGILQMATVLCGFITYFLFNYCVKFSVVCVCVWTSCLLLCYWLL